MTQDLKTSVASINQMAQQVADLNGQIAAAKGTGHAPNQLLDQRDTAVNDLVASSTSRPSRRTTARVGVFIGGGQKLVLGGDANAAQGGARHLRSVKVQIGITEGGTTRAFPDGFVAGGSLAGLLQFQNDDLADGAQPARPARHGDQRRAQPAAGARPRPRQAAVGRRAAALGRRADRCCRRRPTRWQRRAGRLVRRTAPACASRASRISVVDSSQLQPSDYELAADPACRPAATR